MKEYHFIVVIVIWFFACKETAKVNKPEYLGVSPQSIQGTWKNTISQSADFKILNDSMYFLQEVNQPGFPYSIKGDSLIISFPTFKYKFRVIRFAGDSMHLLDEQNLNSFHRI